MKLRIFISSVQREFAEERRMLADYIRRDPLLGSFFSVFLFEESPAIDVSAANLYLPEVESSDIYLGIIGGEYGNVDGEGISPTEREYDAATKAGRERLVFLRKGTARDARVDKFVQKIQSDVVRKSFLTEKDLQEAVYAALVRSLEKRGFVRTTPFDLAFDTDCALSDIDSNKVDDYLRRARSAKKITIPEDADAKWILEKLEAISQDGKVSNTGVLLFGKNPQSHFMSSEVKCLQYWGTKVERPIPSYQIYDGGLLGMIESAVSFVMGRTNHEVGEPENGASAPGRDELPYLAVREAIVNAVCHRDYVSHGGVQVMVFRDRVEILNPGSLPKGWTVDMLTRTHHSEPRNECIAKALNWAGYVERSGNGTESIVERCQAYNLRTPEFLPGNVDFRAIIWRKATSSHETSGETLAGPKSGPQSGPKSVEERILSSLAVGELSSAELAIAIGQHSLSGKLKLRIKDMLSDGIIEYTIPDKPRSRLQKYRLTDKGRGIWSAHG